MSKLTNPLMVYLPDTRGVMISRFGKGNLKIGANVFTYSRLPGLPKNPALGSDYDDAFVARLDSMHGTCPGASPECLSICYASRPVAERAAVARMWQVNTHHRDVPELPADAKLLRIHVSGDFDTVAYIHNWIHRLMERPDVTAWAYTRSWRIPSLLSALERLRSLPNMQLFASMDASIAELPPAGWRRAWIDGDARAGDPQLVQAHMDDPVTHNLTTFDGGRTYICPEETKRQPDCEACKYCFAGKEHDVTFLRH